MFTEVFMQRALMAALLLGPVCACLGVFVTARKMAFFSDTISHAALAGVALGFWFGFADPTLPMIAFSLLVAAAMIWLRENTELLTDTIMALLLSGSVAFGIILLSRMRGLRGELHRYLFGDILAVGWQEVGFAGILFLIVMAALARSLNSLTLLTANEDLAHVCGVPVRRLNYLFVVILTLTVAVSIRMLGIILVTSLLVIPPAAARNISRNLRQQILLSVLTGLLGAVGGILLAYPLEVPCGATIVMVCVGIFLVTLIVGRFRPRRKEEVEA
ncbi:MAG: metal ABC transporter permease [Opitutaceae bacterium]|nr:metal ABC transporter permease [Verrucomicrobiales bacterium]